MKKYCVLLLLVASTGSWAQTDSIHHISIGLELVTHGETCGGGLPRSDDVSINEDRSHFLFGRTRLIADYSRKGLQAHAVVQNKAVWGMSGNQSLNLYEGWVKLTANNGLFVQAGRVALAYDDERMIGPNDFATAALSHDIVRAGYEGHGHQLHAILAYNQNGDNVYNGTYYDNGAQAYKTMQTVWYHYDVPKFPLGASLLFMNLGLQAGGYKEVNDQTVEDEVNPPRTEYQQMWGGYFNFHPKYLTLEGSYYRQTGKVVNEDKYPKPIKAWMASVKATVNPADSYGFQLGYDYLSGDDYVPVAYGGPLVMVNHPEIGGFSPLYGSRTKFYGIMDYFYQSAYTNGFTPGLQNVFLGVFGKPAGKLNCSATYHYLAVATKPAVLNRTLGHSIELQASYQFSKDITLLAGYTQMFGTETMACLKQDGSSKRARWGWFTLAVSPSLFTAKW
ncbi:MAG: hypothetical protein J6Q22_18180 [Prevotella sp.]|nr:hypothetical protein [Prevotella sp.]